MSDVHIGPGEEWLVVTCHQKTCQAVLLLEPARAEFLDEDGLLALPPGLFEVACHHCGLQSSYARDEVRIQRATQRH